MTTTGDSGAGALSALMAREGRRFAQGRPRAAAAHAAGAGAFLGGVPMHWMRDWPTPFPLILAEARGARLTDIDGYGIDDFCLGDTAAMFGHSPAPVARAIRRQAGRGLAAMLPTEAAFEAGRLLCDTFGPYRWQVATSATDANRFALRVARAVTGRPRVLVFDGAYHGTVDDTMIALRAGRTVPRAGLVGQAADLTQTGVAATFNDLGSVEAALARGDVAAVLCEPVMTNCAMVLPDPGFHDALRALTRRHGTLLMIDETHTLSTGLGGYSRTHGLDPDIFVAGKAVAGGVAAAVWGLSAAVADRFAAQEGAREAGHSGMGTTLAGNPLQLAALAATLAEVMTPAAYAAMEAGAARLAAGLAAAIGRHGLAWHVVRSGARVELVFTPRPLRNGAEAAATQRPDLSAALTLILLNRGCLIAPFHTMMLVSPVTTRAQIDRLTGAVDEAMTLLATPDAAP
jgi:glutamate-1-semialdehyde 2,1-aminomutase